MKPSQSLFCCATLSAALLLTGGCKESGERAAAEEAPITGKPTDPPVEMKAQWKPGQRYTMHLEMTQSGQMPWGRGTGGQESSIGQDYTVTATDVPGGGRKLDLEINALAVEAGAGDRVWLRYDSLNKVTPNEGPSVELLDKLIGGRIRYLLDADNKVTQVDGVQELFARLDGGAANTTRGPGGQRGGGRFGGGGPGGILQRFYNADVFKQLVDVSGLPQNATRIGDTWSVTKDVPAAVVGTLVLTTTNRLKGWQVRDGKNCARIEFTGTLVPKGKTENLPFLGGLKLENGKINGTSWFSPDIGLPVETTLNQTYTLTGTRAANFAPRRGTNAPAGATNAPPEKFSSPMRQTFSVKLTEVQPAPAPASAAGTEQK